MYQGKFDAKQRGQQSPDETLQKILEEREQAKLAAAKRPAPQPKAPAAAPAAKPAAPAAKPAAPAAKPQAPAAKPQTPAKSPVPAAKTAPEAPKPQAEAPAGAPAKPQASAPAAKPAAKTAKAAPQKRGPSVGSVIFYTFYFLFIFLFFVGTFFVLQWLNGWLLNYEAAQPTVKSQEVFDEYFAHPDWQKLYEMSSVLDTKYEGAQEYANYMEEKVGSEKLNYVQTSAGTSGDMKYIVRLGTEKIATFTLVDRNKAEGLPSDNTTIPDWTMGGVELIFDRDGGYLIQKLDGHVAYVNGVALDDTYTIQIASTKADSYLPMNVSGVRVCTQQITGLMTVPTVTIYNQVGEEMPVIYNEETGTFEEQTTATTITDTERDLAFNALKAYGGFMINASGSRAAVSKYFDGASETYNRILKMAQELWMNHDYGHTFENEKVDWYAKYSDELFAVHASLDMVVTCSDKTTKTYPINQSMFFRLKNGKWVCTEMSNEDISVPVGQVRLTFMNGQEELSSSFVDTTPDSIMTPVVAVPEGKVFSGWVRQGLDENGKMKLFLVFTPDENGLVTLNSSTALEPMVLYAYFENAAEGGN